MEEIAAMRPGVAEALHGASILLVDDYPMYLDILQHVLRTVGARTTIARNGAEALGLLAAGDFCCVLVDVHMPVMDGIEMARRIRAVPELAEVTVIAMSGNASLQIRELCLASGADDFIEKPFKLAELLARLAAQLDGKRGGQQVGNSAECQPAGDAGEMRTNDERSGGNAMWAQLHLTNLPTV